MRSMNVLEFNRIGLLFFCMFWVVISWAQLASLNDLAIDKCPDEKLDRTEYLSDLIFQSYDYEDSVWEDRYKYSATYDNQGLCTEIKTYFRGSAEWVHKSKSIYAYDNENRLILNEYQSLEYGSWVPTARTEFTYSGNNLTHIDHSRRYSSEYGTYWYTPDATSFFYDSETGLLDYAMYVHSNAEMPTGVRFQYEYNWDAQGRMSKVQSHRNFDGSWEIWRQYIFSYLQEDQSTYEQHLQSEIDSHSCFYEQELRIVQSSSPILWDEILCNNYSVQNETWNPYQKWDYIYNQDNGLTAIQCIDFEGGNPVPVNETQYDYLANQVYRETIYFNSDGELYPRERYLYEYSTSAMEDDNIPSPSVQNLSIYPNPFKQGTAIEFEQTKNDNTTLCVYNLKGQKVCELCNSALEMGYHRFEWDGKDTNGKKMPTGIYFIRLSSPCKAQVKKITLL